MLGAHERILPKQSVIPAILLEQISPVCGGKLVSNLPFLAESKISNMFDIFLARVPFCSLCAVVKAIFLTLEKLYACAGFDCV